MFEQWQYEIGENTAASDFITQNCKISTGTIKRLSVYFPFGVEYLARCRVLLGSSPLLPRSKAGYITSNGTAIDTGDIVEPTKGNEPKLVWELWNLDDTYHHTLTLSCAWVSEEEAEVQKRLMRESNVYLKMMADCLLRL